MMSTGSSVSIKTYRNKPLEKEAYQITRDLVESLLDSEEALLDGDKLIYFLPWQVRMEVSRATGKVSFLVKTLEGDSLAAKVDDYIIRGIRGEIYPCRKDIFEDTYEAVLPKN